MLYISCLNFFFPAQSAGFSEKTYPLKNLTVKNCMLFKNGIPAVRKKYPAASSYSRIFFDNQASFPSIMRTTSSAMAATSGSCVTTMIQYLSS